MPWIGYSEGHLNATCAPVPLPPMSPPPSGCVPGECVGAPPGRLPVPENVLTREFLGPHPAWEGNSAGQQPLRVDLECRKSLRDAVYNLELAAAAAGAMMDAAGPDDWREAAERADRLAELGAGCLSDAFHRAGYVPPGRPDRFPASG
jgi:hypothetical protein